MFTNEHLDLHPLRRCKVVLESVLTEGKYEGKTFSELLDLDLDHATHMGDKVDNNWTWPVLQKWKRLCNIRDQKKNYKPDVTKPKTLYRNGKMFFGKYKGQKISTIMRKNPSYIKWLKSQNFTII